jgi:penicillin-insensitive murein endopeptidase
MLGVLIFAAAFGLSQTPNAPRCERLKAPKVRTDLPRAPSVARGKPQKGTLVSPAQVPLDGKVLAIMPGERRQRRRNYSTTEMVTALTLVGEKLRAAYPGATLYTGDLSAKSGGYSRGHRSHQNGLDADIAFFYRDRQGRLVTPEDLYKISFDGLTSEDGRFTLDVALTWDLVAGLVTNPHIEVQWLFVSMPIRERLLARGREVGAPDEVMTRAETVLWQPGDSSPHDDHLHLRIYCPPSDRLLGCEDTGPVWEWVLLPPPPPEAPPATQPASQPVLASPVSSL